MGSRPLLGLVAFLLVVGVVIGVPWASTEATPARITELEGLCESRVGLQRKCMAVAELLAMETGVAREALERLAGSADDRTATLALSALGREGSSASRNKLTAVLGTSSRSDTARAAALTAWCCAEKKRGRGWTNVREFLEDEVDGNDDLEAALTAVKARVFDERGE
jgi:hypothetical protein